MTSDLDKPVTYLYQCNKMKILLFNIYKFAKIIIKYTINIL